MPAGSLSPLQARVLALLADVTPPWTLSCGGALAGAYLGHRTTRDLDLFWHGTTTLGQSPDDVIARLVAAGSACNRCRRRPRLCN